MGSLPEQPAPRDARARHGTDRRRDRGTAELLSRDADPPRLLAGGRRGATELGTPPRWLQPLREGLAAAALGAAELLLAAVLTALGAALALALLALDAIAAGAALANAASRRGRAGPRPADCIPDPRAVSVVIPSADGAPMLDAMLPALHAALLRAGGEHEVLVVDNASQDGTAELLRDHYPWVRVVQLADNRGFAAGAMAGIRAARREVVVVLHNDMVVAEDFLPPLLEAFDDPAVFAVSARLEPSDPARAPLRETGKTSCRLLGGQLHLEHRPTRPGDARDAVEIAWASGGSSAFDRRKLLELGGFDPVYAPLHGEDVELSLRARQRGWTVRYQARSRILHAQCGTTRRLGPSARAEAQRRNDYLLVWRNALAPLDVLAHGVGLARALLRRARAKALADASASASATADARAPANAHTDAHTDAEANSNANANANAHAGAGVQGHHRAAWAAGVPAGGAPPGAVAAALALELQALRRALARLPAACSGRLQAHRLSAGRAKHVAWLDPPRRAAPAAPSWSRPRSMLSARGAPAAGSARPLRVLVFSSRLPKAQGDDTWPLFERLRAIAQRHRVTLFAALEARDGAEGEPRASDAGERHRARAHDGGGATLGGVDAAVGGGGHRMGDRDASIPTLADADAAAPLLAFCEAVLAYAPPSRERWAAAAPRPGLTSLLDRLRGTLRRRASLHHQVPSFLAHDDDDALRRAARDALDRTDFDLVQVEDVRMAHLLRRELAGAPAVYVAHESLGVAAHRALQLARGPARLVAAWRWIQAQAFEQRLLASFPHLVFLSSADAAHFRARAPQSAAIHTIASAVDLARDGGRWNEGSACGAAPNEGSASGAAPAGAAATATERPRGAGAPRALDGPRAAGAPRAGEAFAGEEPVPAVAFVGYFGREANVDAAQWLARAIFPRVRKAFPAARLWILGAQPPAAVRSLAALPGVEVAPAAADLERQLRRAAVLAVPLRLGSGLSPDVLLGWSSGLAPVVTSRGGAGLPVQHHGNALVADDASTFAAYLLACLRDPGLRLRLARAGRDTARTRCAPAAMLERYDQVYAAVLASATHVASHVTSHAASTHAASTHGARAAAPPGGAQPGAPHGKP